jgi:hypothetical protein
MYDHGLVSGPRYTEIDRALWGAGKSLEKGDLVSARELLMIVWDEARKRIGSSPEASEFIRDVWDWREAL